MWGCVLGRFVGGFFLFRCLGKYKLQVGEGSECFFVEVTAQFFLEVRSHVLRRREVSVNDGDGGVRNVFVLKNTMTDIIVARVFFIHRRQQ